ncbi:MAG TPA: spore gernimation protein, partial [Ruminococcaceae bacterium]|nr:spore gernimation protein [Oscillospiraceae bacterium]
MIIHVVKPGDSLYTLAKQYGISLNDILQVNKLSDPNILTVGQSVIIPQQRA